MSKKIITHNNGVVETRETFYTEETIQQLRHQLEQAQTRISELEDKDWYEANIKQLEEQNDRLIQERDSLKQHLSIKIEELHVAYCAIENVKTKNGELKAENKILKEFADKLDEEFGKNVEPTLSEKADNIIALYRTNKKYCEIADEKIKELKRQLEEKDKELEKWSTQYAVAYVHRQNALIAEKEELKQQLEEKGKEIKRLEEVDDIWFDSYKYSIDELKKQLQEKDKDIERLKDFIGCKGCVDVIKKSNEDQTQLAITELEKVKVMTEWKFNSIVDVVEYIDNQIKKLKGE